jgi:Domain of unknown function (DUF4440)
MGMAETLLELEYKQWKMLSSDCGAAFYRETLTDDSLMAVPSPYGVMSRDRIIREVEAAPPIVHYALHDPQVIRLGADSGVVVYRMTQQRRAQPRFAAAISSVYVRRDGQWQMAYHQQTPLDEI